MCVAFQNFNPKNNNTKNYEKQKDCSALLYAIPPLEKYLVVDYLCCLNFAHTTMAKKMREKNPFGSNWR